MELCKGCYYSQQAGSSKGCCAQNEVPSEGCSIGEVYSSPYKDEETGKLFTREEL